MYTVGDGPHAIAGKHPARYFGMTFGDTIDIIAHVHGQPGQIQFIPTGQTEQGFVVDEIIKQAMDKLIGESILSRFDRCMGSEVAQLTHGRDIIRRFPRSQIIRRVGMAAQ